MSLSWHLINVFEHVSFTIWHLSVPIFEYQIDGVGPLYQVAMVTVQNDGVLPDFT